jgi:broad specificity phosphatase PhoE
MLVYAVRHAESLTNAGLDEGLNSALSSLGEDQTSALARRFSGVRITAIYSSPFLRCLQAALPVAQAAALPVFIRPELSEHHHLEPGTAMDLGLDSVRDIVRRHPGVVPCPDYPGPFDWPAADESSGDVIARMRAFAAFLKHRWPDSEDTIVLFSHGSPIARLIEAWLTDQPGPWFRFTIDNAAVSAFRYYDGVSSLVCMNEISHLAALPAPKLANFRDDGSIKAVPPNGYW